MSTSQNWTDGQDSYKGQPDSDDKKRKRKGFLVGLAAVLAFLLLGVGGIGIYSIAQSRESVDSFSERDNVMALVYKYVEQGEYDRALDLLEDLLIKNADDPEAQVLIDEIIALKNKAISDDSNQGNSGMAFDAAGFAEGLRDVFKEQFGDSGSTGTSGSAGSGGTGGTSVGSSGFSEEAAQVGSLAEGNAGQDKPSADSSLENGGGVGRTDRDSAGTEGQGEEGLAQQKAEDERRLAERKEQLRAQVAKVNDEMALGKSAVATGEYDEAIEHFDAARDMLPKEDKEFSAQQMAEAALAMRDASDKTTNEKDKKKTAEAAHSYAMAALEHDSKNPASHYILGKEAYDSEDWQNALVEYTQAVRGDSGNYLYYYELGKVQYSMQKFSEARASFETSCRLNARFKNAQYNLGLTLSRLGRRDEAIAAYRKASSIDPLYDKAFLAEARLLQEKKDTNGAISAYQSVLKIDSSNTDALRELGTVYASVEQYEEAERQFRKALALSEDDPLTNYNLSTALYGQGKINDSLGYASKSYTAVKSDSAMRLGNKVSIIYNYALLLDEAGRRDEAITIYREALELEPNHVRSLINLGNIFVESGDGSAALTFLTKAVELEPSNFEANNNLGKAYLQQKSYRDAVGSFQKALKIQPEDNDVRANLARAYASAEDYENARTMYTDVVKADNKNWDAYIELAKVCMSLSAVDDAEKYLIYVQEKNPTYRSSEVNTLLSSL